MAYFNLSQSSAVTHREKHSLSTSSIDFPISLPLTKADFSVGSPAQVLHHIIASQESGKIVISDPRDTSVAWQIYVGKGEIHFATSLVGQQERLGYLQKYSDVIPFSTQLKTFSDYQLICAQWQAGRLTLTQLRQVLTLITQDAVVQVLKLPQALIRVEKILGLDPLLMSVPLTKLLVPIQTQLLQWKRFQSTIASPLQRPSIQNRVKWEQIIHDPRQSLPRLQFIAPLLEGQFCLYQIAQEMGVSLLEILPLLDLLIRQNIIKMLPYVQQKPQSRPTIACIDTNPDVQSSVKVTLNSSGYDTVSVLDPEDIWSACSTSQPVMVLMDIDQFDGYSFVKALQHSSQFKHVPIVALTENQGMFNRLWARRIGAMNCLVKPFAPYVLNSLVHQLVA